MVETARRSDGHVDPRSNELMLVRRAGGDGLGRVGAAGCPLAMRFDPLAAVQLQGNDETCALVRILSARLCTTALLQDLSY